ncbi:TAXI family TRAP transporter solute-binding subunit [Haloparvum sedimenti]|uniref:TAXI family TRAP transporter solute-binding subunit n=1 Tax=Haloparvum sedimenti TaxID=1678448 RepID=UPI00071E818D|nr:TAXI family TRAP transporter solute-binding subunit [Haloparvum sedimenti]
MTDSTNRSRRDVVKGATTLGVIGLAGCTGDEGDGDDGGDSSGDGSGDGGDDGIDEYDLVVGTSGSGTPTEAAGQALARACSEESDFLTLTVQNTDGWSANLIEYDQGTIPAMGVDNNSLANALADEGPYEDNPVDDLPHLGFMYTNLDIHFVATEESGVTSTTDLYDGGYDVYPLQPGAGTRALTEEILRETGVWEANNMLQIEFSEIAGAVEEGRADVIAMYGVNGVALSGWCEEVDLRSDGSLNVVEVDDEFRQVIEDHGGAQLVDVEPYGYQQDVTGITDTLTGWQLVGQWAFGSEVPAEVAYEIARISSEEWETIQESDPTAIDHSGVESMTNGVIPEIPIHPGVADYWEENDVWNDDWTRGELE